MTPTDYKTSPRVWLSGPAGCGKTSAGVNRLRSMLAQGVPGESILVMVPQRSLAEPYLELLLSPDLPSAGQVEVLTFNSLAQRCIRLFWPLVAGQAGFRAPVVQSPTFLTIETAQYHLAGMVREKMDHQGYFAAVKIDPNRLYSQLLDNLNKSALVGFPHTEIHSRLKDAWEGPASQLRVYDQAQDCIDQFREFCLANGLLDYSLQIELFIRHLWSALLCRQYLTRRYLHLIFDNLEEDTPVVHNLLAEWLPSLETVLLITDDDGGYRRFLGADPASAVALAGTLPEKIRMDHPSSVPQAFLQFNRRMAVTLKQPVPAIPIQPVADLTDRLSIHTSRFFPQMLDLTADLADRLIHEQDVPPDQIAIVSPFLPDTLRFSLGQRLSARQIEYHTVRPSRSLREEPLVQCLLTLAKLAHPHWQMSPHRQDVTGMLMQAIADLDPVRASLLAEIVYRKVGSDWYLTGFDQILDKEKSRITYLAGERYETLRKWLSDYQSAPVAELDIFLQRIFGELLTRPGFGFRKGLAAGEITANLIESAMKFRQSVQLDPAISGPVAAQYIRAVEQGLVAAQFQRNYSSADHQELFLGPAHTFLMQNRAVDVQIWLDIGSNGWWERLEQPLTHPYVLSRSWPQGKKWQDDDEVATNQAAMFRLIQGMLLRCRQRVHLVYLEVNEQGFEQQGALLKAFHTTMIHLQKEGGSHED